MFFIIKRKKMSRDSRCASKSDGSGSPVEGDGALVDWNFKLFVFFLHLLIFEYFTYFCPKCVVFTSAAVPYF